MATGFYVKRGEKEQGPFSSKDLKNFAAAGKLKKTDKIRKDNSQKYYPAESVKGLFDVPAPAKKRKSARKAEVEYAGVEVIEEGDASDFDTYDDEFGDVAEFDDVEFVDEYDEFDDVEEFEPEPARKRRSRSPAGPPPARRGAKAKKKSSSTGKPKKKKPVKKADDEEDEEEDGPWANLFYGVSCIAGGIFLFIALGQGSPEDWGRRGGLVKLVVALLYNVGGRWAVLVIAILLGLVLFWAAFEQFKKQADH